MRLVSFLADGKVQAGFEHQGMYVTLQSLGLPAAMRQFLALGPEGIEQLRQAADRPTGTRYQPDTVKLKPPVPDPRKIICVGLNYRDHAKESGSPIPDEPVLFSKFPTALIGHQEPIVLPPVSSQVDYEAELVVVIGTGGRHLTADQAIGSVAGYTCGHDVSARDWQLKKPGGQWLCGKSFDTFAPTGPALVTTDAIPDPHNLAISLRLNGQTMQQSNTRELIFGVPQVVSYVSQVVTLEPGDLIFTGTPPGVGFARKPPVFLKPGDMCEVEIEGIGVLCNPVVQG